MSINSSGGVEKIQPKISSLLSAGLLHPMAAPQYVLSVKDSTGFEKQPLILRRRGGATEDHYQGDIPVVSSETQLVQSPTIIEKSVMQKNIFRWLPTNAIAEICEQDQGNDGTQKWNSFVVSVPRTPFVETYLGSTVVTFVSVLTVVGVAALLYKWLFNSNQASKEGGTNNETKEMNVTAQLLATGEMFDTKLRDSIGSIKDSLASDAIVKLLTAFHERAITKETALSLLKRYHNKTEGEALPLLDTKSLRYLFIPWRNG